MTIRDLLDKISDAVKATADQKQSSFAPGGIVTNTDGSVFYVVTNPVPDYLGYIKVRKIDIVNGNVIFTTEHTDLTSSFVNVDTLDMAKDAAVVDGDTIDSRSSAILAANIKRMRKLKFPGHGGAGKCAAAFKATKAAWSGWERGDWQPRFSNLEKLAKFFGVTVDYLFTEHKN